MEQGGSADGILQVRIDRIQSDLEELLKALTVRCKKHGVHVLHLLNFPMAGNLEFLKSQLFGMKNGTSLMKKSEKPFNKVEHTVETESTYSHSEDESMRSPKGSPVRQPASESPSHDYSDDHSRKSFEAETETQRSFDELVWGTFDNNVDTDSVWGFSSMNVKDSDHEKHGEKYFFESSDFGGSPVRTGSPQADSHSMFPKKSSFTFEGSVPNSPLSRAGNSPPRYTGGSGDQFFNNMSRFDSFSTLDHDFSSRRETFTSFDSINSTSGFDHSRGFSFDDSDPFGSSGPFKVSSESETPKRGSDSWNAF